jgi:hypothetical protein
LARCSELDRHGKGGEQDLLVYSNLSCTARVGENPPLGLAMQRQRTVWIHVDGLHWADGCSASLDFVQGSAASRRASHITKLFRGIIAETAMPAEHSDPMSGGKLLNILVDKSCRK